MKIFRVLFLIPALMISLFANDKIGEILDEFGIKDSSQNREIIKAIDDSISDRDIYNFKTIITARPHNVVLIKDELEKIDAPKFLLFLAMTESEFKNIATSHRKAGGMWQFMPMTAKSFGLSINSYVDERKDPFLSTDTAFKYLDFLNEQFDSWYLSLMAYNCGDGCMRKLINRNSSDDFATLVKSSKTPRETRNFIKKIIKYTLISKDDEVANLIANLEPDISVERIKVSGGTKLSSVANSIGYELEELKKINPHIKAGVAPSSKDSYHFYIPEDRLNLYALNYIGSIIKGEVEIEKYSIHKVVKNETLEIIAKKNGVLVEDIKVANNLKSDLIKVGDELKIPLVEVAISEDMSGNLLSKSVDKALKVIVALNEIREDSLGEMN